MNWNLFRLPLIAEAIFEASNGLADLLEYYDLDPSEIVKGQLRNSATKQFFEAKSNLTSNEALRVASAARKAQYYDGYVKQVLKPYPFK